MTAEIAPAATSNGTVSADKKKAQDTLAEPKLTTSTPSIEPNDFSGTRYTPFATPASSTAPSPPRDPLTSDQETKYTTLLTTVQSWVSPSSTKPLSETEQIWLTRECLLRYLRASSWDVSTATKRIEATLAWRRSYGIYDKITPEYISIENETGKQLILGYDNNGRPCLYLIPSQQNTDKSDRQIEHLVFMMERCIDLLPPGQETLALLMNFADTKSGQSATFAQGKQTLSILQNHYPERLGRALLSNLPWHISTFVRLILPFVDPVTRAKVVFNQPMRDHVPPEQLLVSHGGDSKFDYDHGKYWPALNALAKERRDAVRKRWVEGGMKVGELEAYLKGAENEGVGSKKEKKKKEDGGKDETIGAVAEQMGNVKLKRDSDEFVDAPEEVKST